MKVFNVLAITVFVGAVGFITYNLVKDSREKYYTTTYPERTSIEERLSLSGFVYPSKEVDIKPQLSGVVDAIYVSVGESVKDGDPIASVSLVPNSSEIENLTNNINISKINLATTQANYERQKYLLGKKAISLSEYETAEREYLTAQENYNSAVHQLDLRQRGKKTGNNLIRSSTSGTVIDVPVKLGTSVVERSGYTAGTTIATVASSDHYLFKADVPEKSIGRLSTGTPVNVKLLAYEDIIIDAEIVMISAKGEIMNGAVKFPVEAEFSVHDSSIELRSGYSATAEIIQAHKEDVLAIQEKYICFKGDSSVVYVMDPEKKDAEERLVTLGLSDGEKVEILSGLNEDDMVITNFHD